MIGIDISQKQCSEQGTTAIDWNDRAIKKTTVIPLTGPQDHGQAFIEITQHRHKYKIDNICTYHLLKVSFKAQILSAIHTNIASFDFG